MKSGRSWKKLLDIVQVQGQLDPVSEKQLAAFEAANKIKLPRSYREFCKVFGPGDLQCRIWIHLTTPGRDTSAGRTVEGLWNVSTEVLNREIWSTSLFEVDEYCSQPELVRKGLFFARDIYTHLYFWKKDEITSKSMNELAVYVIYREWDIYRLADSFESFIFDICLDKGIPNQGKPDLDPPVFEPAPRT
jgi:hypothetical protein